MSMTELKVSFPTEKLDALRFFMSKKDQKIELELADYLDKTYEKMVPAQLREYIESRMEQAPVPPAVPERQAAQNSSPGERPPRQTRRQREQAAQDAAATQEGSAQAESPSESEDQGMTMNM